MTCTCLPWMHKGTRIINLASAAAFCPQAKFAVYAATKSYVLSFSRSLALNLRKKESSSQQVCPGPVDTPFFEVSGKLPGGMKEAVMADPVQIVKQALIDAKYKKEGFCIWHGNERGRSCNQSASAWNDLKSHVNDGENNEGVSERQDEDTKRRCRLSAQKKTIIDTGSCCLFWTGCCTGDRRLCDNKDKAQSAHCSSGTRMSSGKAGSWSI